MPIVLNSCKMRVFEVQNSRPENKCIMFIEDSWYLYSWLFLILFSFFSQLKLSLMKENEKWSPSGQSSGYITSGVDTSLICFTREKQSAEVPRTSIWSQWITSLLFCLWRLIWSIVATQHLLFVIIIILSPVCSSNAFCNTFGILVSFRSSVLWCGNMAKKVDW